VVSFLTQNARILLIDKIDNKPMYALFGRIPIVANANSTLWPTLNRYYKNLIFKMKSKSLEGLKAMM